jgi:hypothetical protein
MLVQIVHEGSLNTVKERCSLRSPKQEVSAPWLAATTVLHLVHARQR